MDRERIELSTSECKPDVFPLALTAQILYPFCFLAGIRLSEGRLTHAASAIALWYARSDSNWHCSGSKPVVSYLLDYLRIETWLRRLGFEPRTLAYEASEMPFLHPAIKLLATCERIELSWADRQSAVMNHYTNKPLGTATGNWTHDFRVENPLS